MGGEKAGCEQRSREGWIRGSRGSVGGRPASMETARAKGNAVGAGCGLVNGLNLNNETDPVLISNLCLNNIGRRIPGEAGAFQISRVHGHGRTAMDCLRMVLAFAVVAAMVPGLAAGADRPAVGQDEGAVHRVVVTKSKDLNMGMDSIDGMEYSRREVLNKGIGAVAGMLFARTGLENICKADCLDPTIGLPASINWTSGYSAPNDGAGHVTHGYFSDMFGDINSDTRWHTTDLGYLLEYGGADHKTLLRAIDTGISQNLKAGCLVQNGILLGEGTNLYEGHIQDNTWVEDNRIILTGTNGGSITGLSAAFYLDAAARVKGADNNPIRPYALFVSLDNGQGIKRVNQFTYNGSYWEASLADMGLNSGQAQSVKAIELDPNVFCAHLLAEGGNGYLFFYLLNPNGSIGLETKSTFINLGMVQGFSFSDGYFSAAQTTSGRLYANNVFPFQAHVLGMPTDADNDGVADAIDQCNNTIPNAQVDSTGCPTPQNNMDFDRDGDVDSADTAVFQSKSSGPTVPYQAGNGDADFDSDGDVDQSDFGLFQRVMTGMNIPYNPKS